MGTLITQPKDVADALKRASPRPPCRSVLMGRPDHFKIENALNPWMKDRTGDLKQADPARAGRQWDAMRAHYERVSVWVEVIDAPECQPDFCFAANQSLAFADDALRPHVILARMANSSRRGEVAHYARWYRENDFKIHELPESVTRFEGTGDAIRHPARHIYWGGVGPRTDEAAWGHLAEATGAAVIPLHLVDERFYHLDTCFCALDERTALHVPGAFDAASLQLLRAGFRDLIEVSDSDAANFACNAHCPDGHHVLIQKGSADTVLALKQRGFDVLEVETSEFMKSGGSVFCLKQELP